jgi:hypothetical protein
MNVDTHHPDFDEYCEIWKKCSDAEDGQDAIHASGEKYLPRLQDQSDPAYKNYKCRAVFYNAVARTITGLSGLLLRKAPMIEVNKAVESQFENITGSGESLNDLINGVINEVLEVGRIGLLIDHPKEETVGLTVADVQAMNLKPFIRCYEAENIINWRVTKINNQDQLSLVVLTEELKTYTNEFKFESKTLYRVLDLVISEKGSTTYRQREFIINDKGEDVQIGPDYFPKMNGKQVSTIPFVFINSDSLTPEISEPPLLDLVNMNLAHYRVSADYENGCHMAGLPTPVVSGYSPSNPDEKLYIGSTHAWIFTDPNASASFLEFNGQGMGCLQQNLKDKQDLMAILGARMLANEKKAVEAAQTAEIRQTGENSALATIGLTIGRGLQKALSIYSNWLTSDENVKLEINKDFTGSSLTAQELTALVSAWQAGAISQETLFNNLKAGELYDDSTTFEDEQSKIGDAPPPPPLTPTKQAPANNGA